MHGKVELIGVTFKMPEVEKVQATREIALTAVLSAFDG